MKNKELSIIPEKESDEFIKSSVEDLVPIPSESEDTFGSDSECILPSCDDFSSINVFEEKAVTFSNLFFNLNDDFTSSDDESLSDEDILEDNVKIYSNPLFEFNDEYISSGVNPLFDEVLEDIEFKDSYDSNLDESTFLVTPLSDSNEDKCFTPGDDVELLLHRDLSTPKMSVISILEVFTDEPPLEENDALFDLESKNNEWKKILYDAPIDGLMSEDKVFDPRICEKKISLTYDPDVSLIMKNKELSIIPEKESNEFIKSSVEDLVPIPSESEDTFRSDSECILPSCDDFSSINVFEEKAVTFSNPLFNLNDDFTSSDDESLSDEDIPEDNVKIYSNPLFEFNDEYIYSGVNPLFDEVLEDIEFKDSYDSNLDESTFLVTPLSDSNEDECFTPGDDVELLLHRDLSTPKMSVVSILEGFTDEPPLEENDALFDLESKNNEWKKILYDAPIDGLMSEDKVFDPRICEKKFSLTYVRLPFEDCHNLFLTYVIWIFLPYFSYPVVSPFLLSSRSEDTIFDPGISAFPFSHRSGTFISFNVYPNILNESPMKICSSTSFNPNITMIWGESS
nr:hypothetical protein [Tanacetum cinerariifolium]